MGFIGISYVIPMLFSVIIMVILQPLGYNKFNIIAPVIFINCFSFTLTYAIVKHRIFDLQLFLSPIIKSRKYHFHQEIKHLIKDLPNVFSYEKIATSLAGLFGCDVALNVKGQMVAAVGGDQAFREFQLEREYTLLEEQDNYFKHQRFLLADELKKTHERFSQALHRHHIEALIPLYSQKRLLGIFKFGRGFSKNIYSTQDFNLIANLYEQLLIAINHISIMQERLQIKEKQVKVLKERVRMAWSPQSHNPRPCSQSIMPVSRQNATEPDMIHALLLGDDPKLKQRLIALGPPLLKIDAYSFGDTASEETVQGADLIVMNGRDLMHNNLSSLNESKKPLLIITHRREIRVIAGELFPNILKDFLRPDQMETDLLPACEALIAVQRAVLFENNGNKLISVSPQILEMLPQISAAAGIADCILITGDTGTGKELIASYILHQSPSNKMISINCAAIPESLFESEFFGHEKGAFTSAVQHHKGLLEQARGGFLFLDEIGELPLTVQAKFLRVMDGLSFERVGGNRLIQPDVRYIASTNQYLPDMVEQGRFRADLLFRLNPVHFHLPPLNRRKEDIPLLAHYFLWRYNGEYGKDCRLGKSFIQALQQHPWTGHIRELANIIHQSVLSTADGDIIKRYESLDQEKNTPIHFMDQIQEYEKRLIIEALNRFGSQRAAANHLNLPLSTLHSKIKKYNL